MPRLLALVVIPLALIAATLSGCTATTELPPPEPAREGEPLFATDEEALAAAYSAYATYVRVSNTLSASLDADVSLLEEVALKSHIAEIAESIETLRSQGLRTQGAAEIRSFSLQQHFEAANGDISVLTYVCLDVSGLRVIDADGDDVTPQDRQDLVGLEVVFWGLNDPLSKLKVASSKSWTGSDLCGE